MDYRAKRDMLIESSRKNNLITFRSLQKLLNDAMVQHSKIARYISDVQTDLAQLAPLCGIEDADNPLASMGLTDALRHVIGTSPDPGIDVADIRGILTDAGVKLPESNPVAAINTTIKRLIAAKEVRLINQDGEQDGTKQLLLVWTGKTMPPMLPIPEWMTKGSNEERDDEE